MFDDRRLPSPYNKQTAGGGGSTSIPLPATVTATRRCPPDKVRPVAAPTHQTQLGKRAGINGWKGLILIEEPTTDTQRRLTKKYEIKGAIGEIKKKTRTKRSFESEIVD
ncbi:hypothetical protein KQX54_008874 [Cotesia glomerata]|uniref:Uncharacterized protein n=1 Tax=Cotesia glomerata TaxID=32391 RepID=A0AAV7J015_COTGL|nr:hypothetical protein KQX54_008874 [Cotesia glomerata]